MTLTLNNNELLLKGEISFLNATSILKDFNRLVFTEKTIKLNCEGVSNASSVCLAVIIEMKKILNNQNIKTDIKGLSAPLKALVQVSQLTKVIQ